jgi:tetratricopeptide (TPR) repeat protein
LIPLEDLQDLIARTEQKKGLQDPSLASLYASMGKIYYRRIKFGECQNFQQEYELAIDCFKKAIALQQELDVELELSSSLNYLAQLYRSQGRYSEAKTLYLQALEIQRRSLPENHPGLATSLNNLAALYRSQGRYSEAELLYLQALEIDRRALPENHPSLATRLNNLATLYRSQGRYSEAEPLYLQALEINRRSLPENHPSLASYLNNLAKLYRLFRTYCANFLEKCQKSNARISKFIKFLNPKPHLFNSFNLVLIPSTIPLVVLDSKYPPISPNHLLIVSTLFL